jgi:hypothetical protein
VTGADCRGLLQGKAYRARSINVDDAALDILVNKDTRLLVQPSAGR